MCVKMAIIIAIFVSISTHFSAHHVYTHTASTQTLYSVHYFHTCNYKAIQASYTVCLLSGYTWVLVATVFALIVDNHRHHNSLSCATSQ